MRYLPIFLLLITFPAPAETVHEGKVVRIVDGDTLVLLVDEKQNKIRLSDIDTPEKKQPFGTRAKQAVSELAFGKQARVVEVTVDRYGRIVGRVYVDGIDVNRELVARGYAWVNRKYSDDAELLRLEAEAKQKSEEIYTASASPKSLSYSSTLIIDCSIASSANRS
jgi:endonuclease YncB( thermonuclease family)